MKKLILFIFLLALFSCNKSNDQVFVETAFSFSCFNQNGQDLLDTLQPNASKPSAINIYYLLEGKKIKQFNKNLDFPKSFFIFYDKERKAFVLQLFPNADKKYFDKNNCAITYIDWGNNQEDTVKCQYKTYPNNHNIQVTKIWYNQVLKWQYTTGSSVRWFKIIK